MAGAQDKLGSRSYELEGLDEWKKMVDRISPKRAISITKQAVQAVAGKGRNEMRKHAPKKSGTLKKAIVAKRRRGKPDLAVSDVIITHGKGVKHDAWYWHMVEWETAKTPAQPFIRPAISKVEQQIPILFRQEMGKRLEKELHKVAQRQGVV